MSCPWIAPAEDSALAPAQARYLAALADQPDSIYQAGRRLLARIATPNWLVEWNLPRWLGAAFGLTPQVTGELVLSNLFGLAFTRLQDDLFDGEQDCEPQDAAVLVSILYQGWIGAYRRLFAAASPFWEYLDHFCGQWLRASLEQGGPDGAALQAGSPEALRRLAERGAPLKACCAAACLLAGHETVNQDLLAGITYLLSGAVLVDHAGDWQADLAAGRYNALAAFIASDADHGQASRQAILEALCFGSAARPYFELACRQFRRARDCVSGLGIGELEAYLAWAEVETAAFGRKLAKNLKQQLRMATAELMRSM